MSDYYDSDSDCNENEKILLDKYRKRKYESDDEDEEGIFNVAPDEDESDDDGDILQNSDIEGQEEDDDIPDEKAWGRNKKAYYSTDYVHPNTYNEKEVQFGEFEAEEAKKIEGEIWRMLEGSEFPEDVEKREEGEQDLKEEDEDPEKEEEDISLNLINDFKEFTELYKSFLKPFKEKYRSGEIEKSQLTEFVESFSSLILNYSSNILMYLLLKSENTPTKNHPIMKRLAQYRELIEKLHTVFEETIKSKLKSVLEEKKSKSVEPKKKKLKLLQNLVVKEPVHIQKKKKEVKSEKQTVRFTEEDEIHEITNEQEENIESGELAKRPITYQMAKNKGLTPRRKKEQRNPRVKHRNKYKKAKIRRKGAVRDVRTEGHRYGGEISGINANVLKGIKLKV